MTIRASCKTCDSRNRAEIEASRAAGASFATLARNYGGAEATIRRHFRLGHARPRPTPAPAPVARRAPVSAPAPAPARYVGAPTRGSVPLARVEEAAALLGVPVAELAWCVSEHMAFDVATPTEPEEERLYELFDAAEESPDYAGAVRVSVTGLVRIVA